MNSVWDKAFWVVVGAIVFVLVRPGSQAAGIVRIIGDTMADVIGTATGWGAGPNQPGTGSS